MTSTGPVDPAVCDLDAQVVGEPTEAGADPAATRLAARRRGLRRGGTSMSGDGQHSPTVSVVLPREVRDRVVAQAAAEGMSVSKWLRRLVVEKVGHPGTQDGRPRRWWPTTAEIAADVRANLAASDTSHALRMLMDGVNYLPDADSAGRLDEALVEPETTGDVRWDALLAGAVRYRLHQMGRTAPSWTRGKKPLDRFWWPLAFSASDAYNDMAHTPAELRRLGIFVDEREFSQA
ncbi:MAG: hypothetical protein FWH11_09135 [Micrococcales bacterium]|nr:hypothetical protein [Micrococcales bacterium]